MSLSTLFLMSECVSPVKTGGLADVAGALPAALRASFDPRRVSHLHEVQYPQYESSPGTMPPLSAEEVR